MINKNLTISGAGARATTITGSGQSRVFDISSGTVSISGVTMTGGNGMDTPGGTAGDGGAILSGGTLTITDSTVTGNSTQGSFEGGGIQNDATLSVIRSTISFNSALGASRGGGIGDSGRLSVTDSTVAHNALGNGGLGAGIYVNNAGAGSVVVLDDTFDLNAAGPSGSNIDLNGESGPTTVANTIILGGTSDSCTRFPAVNPSGGGNIEDQASCEFTQPTDHQNASQPLGALQNNGGPSDTQLPALGSLAVDAGNDAYCSATDQRGVSRPQGTHCDSGSVEVRTPSVGTPAVSGTTTTGATLTTLVDTKSQGGTFSYQYGTTTAYGSTTTTQTLGPSSTSAAGSLSGLTPGTVYHVKLTLTTADGTVSSTDVTFSTVPPPPPAPVMSGAHMLRKRFRVGNGPTALSGRAKKKPPIGTSFVFNLSSAAKVQITILRTLPGLRTGSRCVAPNKKLKRNHAKHCTRTIVYGTLVRSNEPAGRDQVAFTGRIGKRPLAPNSYQALIIASNAGGRSKQSVLAFTVVK